MLGRAVPCASCTSGASGVVPVLSYVDPGEQVSFYHNSALYRVSWVQKVGHSQVTEHLFVTQVVDAARRILARPPEHKKPLAADQVMRIISRLEKGSLADVQVAAIFAMGFFGF